MSILKNMQQRERLMVVFAGVFVTIIILWLGVFEPLAEKKETLKRKIEAKASELIEVTALAKRIAKEKKSLERFERDLKNRPEKLSPLAAMESLAENAGIRKNIVSMSPQQPAEVEGYRESTIDLKVKNVSLPELTLFIKSMRGSKSVLRMKRISIKPKYEDASVLDVSMSVTSYDLIK